jgi:acetyl esterase/lipase
MFDGLTAFVAAQIRARSERRTAMLIENLPAEVQKDIGWRWSPRGPGRAKSKHVGRPVSRLDFGDVEPTFIRRVRCRMPRRSGRMPSLKSHIVALVLKHTRKKAFASAEAIQSWIRAARLTESHRPPQKLRENLDITERKIAGRPVYEVRPSRLTSRQRIVYLHGGAFVFEISRYHWMLIAELAERLGARVTVPVYPIAPEHGFDAIFGMAMALYEDVLAEEKPGDVAFVGDSAGATMAVVLTMMAAERGLPSPGRHVLVSPGLDMTLSNPEVYEVAKIDPWLGIPGGLEVVRLVAGDIEHSDWRVSPLYGDLSVLPKTLIFTGTREILSPDTVIFAEKARQAGVDVELVLERGMFHDWVLFPQLKEARRARDRIVAFLKEAPVRQPKPAAISAPGTVRTVPSP